MPAFRQQVPHNAADADARLGGRRAVRLDRNTRLVRQPGGDVGMRYTRLWSQSEEWTVLTWKRDGSIVIDVDGFMFAALRRINVALSETEWSIQFRGRRMRARLMYRRVVPVMLTGSIRLSPDGTIRHAGGTFSPADMESEYDEVMATMEAPPVFRPERRPRRQSPLSLPRRRRGSIAFPNALPDETFSTYQARMEGMFGRLDLDRSALTLAYIGSPNREDRQPVGDPSDLPYTAPIVAQFTGLDAANGTDDPMSVEIRTTGPVCRYIACDNENCSGNPDEHCGVCGRPAEDATHLVHLESVVPSFLRRRDTLPLEA